jgi:hypothetical protein
MYIIHNYVCRTSELPQTHSHTREYINLLVDCISRARTLYQSNADMALNVINYSLAAVCR